MYEHPSEHVAERLRKRKELVALGVDPYPVAAYRPTHSIAGIRSKGEAMACDGARVKIAGRIVARRDMGKVLFIDLLDEGESLQIYLQSCRLDRNTWRAVELLDLGDFVGIEGEVFFTRTAELSVMVEALTVLGKASHPIPLPKKEGGRSFDAVTDKGVLYRHRHIDLVCNQSSRDVFLNRSRIIRGIRRYLDDQGFLEVETPILGNAYGGAAARPFSTRVNALDQEMFLRISPECALKRLLCGGLNKVYEIGKSFRNEGLDASHNPEFTMVEWYEAYSDYLEQMCRFETLVSALSREIRGTTQISYRGRTLDLSPPWRRLPMLDGLRDEAGLDVREARVEDFPSLFRARHPAGESALPQPLTWGTAVVELFQTLVEPHLWGPVFVMDHPVEISPLTKRHRVDQRLVERFEPIVAGMEIGNSYSELNDPVEQYDRLLSQQVARDDAYDLDRDFLDAVAHGMPPAGGTGLGVDRLVMVLTGAASIRDVVFFPLLTQRSASGS